MRSALVSSLTLVAFAACEPPQSTDAEVESGLSLEVPIEFRSALADLGARYGFEITWQGGPYRYDYDWGWGEAREAAEWEIEAFAPILSDELGLYPADFFRKANIRRVILARDLWLEQEGVEQNIAGYIFGDSILMNVAYTYKVNNRDKQRRYMHHLIWHVIDGISGTTWEDPEWVALNPEGFEYGVYTRGGIHDRSSQTGLLSTEFPGFINRYGTGNVPDDKADLFAYLMVVHHWVEERAAEDPFIRAKVDTIKARLAAFDPGFGEDFWGRVDAIGRDVTPYVTP
jgi:hypothetical protein